MAALTIKQVLNRVLFVSNVLLLSSCATSDNLVLGEEKSAWDFDHHLQFKKTKYDDNHYKLEVITSKKVNFQRMSAFLLRRSSLICGGDYGYQLTLIKGVESFDFKRSSPNKIRTNLTAKLECPAS